MTAKTNKSLQKNLSKLTTTASTTKKRRTRIDKKPVFTKVKSDEKWELCNGNGNCSRMFPWYLQPVKADLFNRSWFSSYDHACTHIQKMKLRPEDYTLWQLTKRKS